MRKVSVQVITLNEEANIRACLEAIQRNQPEEIVVIDGGSDDRTTEIAAGCGAKVITPGKLGRGASRRLGYMSTSLPLVAMVDADDRIEPDWLLTMTHELERGGYAALQSCLQTTAKTSFWERGWNEYFHESIKPVTDTNMVGHPALYLTSALVEADSQIGNDHEDTQMSMDFQRRQLRQGVGTAVSHRVVPTTWQENRDKWIAYGTGYRDLIERFPDRKRKILFHILIRIPVVRGLRPLLRGKLEQPVFCLLMACCIWIGYAKNSSSH